MQIGSPFGNMIKKYKLFLKLKMTSKKLRQYWLITTNIKEEEHSEVTNLA